MRYNLKDKQQRHNFKNDCDIFLQMEATAELKKVNKSKRVKENIKAFPFHDVSSPYGEEWSRDTLIEEIKRRQEFIISEPDGIVRETMIDNLLVGLQ